MSRGDVIDVLRADGLTAVARPGGRWSVYREGEPVGVLEQRGAGERAWLAGRIADDVAGDLVAEGPTALAVLRRLATRGELAAAASPVRR